jgi:hypothetical protein
MPQETFKSLVGRLFGVGARTGTLAWLNADNDGTNVYQSPFATRAAFRNLLDGGDFTVNPFQRGVSQAANISNTLTYGPDRWAFLGGASSAIQWSQQSDQSVRGFNNSLRWQRASGNANNAPLNAGLLPLSGPAHDAELLGRGGT